MAKKSISSQFDDSFKVARNVVSNHMVNGLTLIGDRLINEILPSQAEYGNLTGNTITSYAYGVYVNGVVQKIGIFSNGEPAIRVKLSKDEILRGFEDYDGNIRNYFKADVNTNRGYGDESSFRFLASYKPKGKYSLVITTGTEYSSYLENVLGLNVLSDSIDTIKTDFLKSFKKI